MTRHRTQYAAIAIMLVGLAALSGNGQAQQQEITGKDGAPMVLVPAGEFTMGSNEAVEEKPVHQVSLDAYYMDRYQVTVEQFAKFLGDYQDRNPVPLVFAIGGADGFGKDTISAAHHVISLGKMTLAHELARVVLLEQVYRAFTILKGHPYHSGH